MKGEIKVAYVKNKSILFVNEDTDPKGRWFNCTDDAFQFAKKGIANIGFIDGSNVVNKIDMVSLTPEPTKTFQSGRFTPKDPAVEEKRQRMIVRQNCIGNAINYIESQDVKMGTKELLDIAEILERWVFR